MSNSVRLTNLYTDANIGPGLRGFGNLPADANLYSFSGNTGIGRLRQGQDPQYKAALQQQRAAVQKAKFSYNGVSDNMFNAPIGNISTAMNDLASILGQNGVSVMYDGNGYFGYQVNDKNGNSTYSTNLTRLRRAFAGLNIGDGPDINVTTNVPFSKNRMWTAVIAWHKFLNASRGYNSKYRSQGIEGAYSNMVRKSRSNLQKTFVSLAQPGALEQKYDQLKRGLANTQAKYDQRFRRLEYVSNNRNQLIEIGAIPRDGSYPRYRVPTIGSLSEGSPYIDQGRGGIGSIIDEEVK